MCFFYICLTLSIVGWLPPLARHIQSRLTDWLNDKGAKVSFKYFIVTNCGVSVNIRETELVLFEKSYIFIKTGKYQLRCPSSGRNGLFIIHSYPITDNTEGIIPFVFYFLIDLHRLQTTVNKLYSDYSPFDNFEMVCFLSLSILCCFVKMFHFLYGTK